MDSCRRHTVIFLLSNFLCVCGPGCRGGSSLCIDRVVQLEAKLSLRDVWRPSPFPRVWCLKVVPLNVWLPPFLY